MKILILLIILLLIITKLLDIVTTIKRIKYPHQETNPLAQKLMIKIGIKTTAWIVFGFVTGVFLLVGLVALQSDALYQILFVGFGLTLAIIQFAVAHSNWTQKMNFITTGVWSYHRMVNLVFGKIRSLFN